MNLKALWKIQYGMYIVSSKKNDGELNGQIANTVFQITAEPPTMGISINKQNYTHEFIDESGVFSISILSESAPMTLMGRFGFKCGRDIDKFEDTQYKIGKTGAPIITEHSLGFVECEVINKVDMGSHTIFIGKVIEADDIDNDGKPMTYSYYHLVKNGKVPKTATHYIDEKELEKDKDDSKKTEDKMDKYVCDVCGYVYDPEQGDPDSGIEPGTKFEDLPEDWVCPVCGVGKDQFSKQ